MNTTSAGRFLPEAGAGGPGAGGPGAGGQSADGTTSAPHRGSGLAAALRRLLPRTIQLCVHCRENPAGFWVSRQGDRTARRPWCLSCGNGADWRDCDVIPFGQ